MCPICSSCLEIWSEKASGEAGCILSDSPVFFLARKHHRVLTLAVAQYNNSNARATRIVNPHESVKHASATPSVPISAGGSVFLPGLEMRMLQFLVDKAPASGGEVVELGFEPGLSLQGPCTSSSPHTSALFYFPQKRVLLQIENRSSE